jgi:zinc D-Ala-D-Ala dipeptidase
MIFSPHPLRDQLVPLNPWVEGSILKIDLAYANKHHPDNQFGQLYAAQADTLWLEINLAKIVIAAAYDLKEQGFTLVVLDGLRPIEAQEVMAAKGFPEGLVARAGQGGHPRAMAVDVFVLDQDNKQLDMGTPFDFFVSAEEFARGFNPAARDFNVTESVKKNRKILDNAMMGAAARFDLPLIPYAAEWWDFRFPKEIFLQYNPLSNNDLYDCQKLMGTDVQSWHDSKNNLPDSIKRNIETLGDIFS